MVTRARLIEEFRTWLHTPYRHQGRVKGRGVDCAGLIVCTLRDLGLVADDMTGYTSRPDGTLRGFVEGQTERVALGEQQPGDMLLFQWRNDPFHLAVLTGENTIIHSFAINREVCEHSIDEKWRKQIACYRKFIGVE
jgi:cell wall-associated NlpC family hydrolase